MGKKPDNQERGMKVRACQWKACREGDDWAFSERANSRPYLTYLGYWKNSGRRAYKHRYTHAPFLTISKSPAKQGRP